MSVTMPPRVRAIVKGFFEKRTNSVQYVVADPETRHCAIIDPVLDFDPKSGATATHSADEVLAYIAQDRHAVGQPEEPAQSEARPDRQKNHESNPKDEPGARLHERFEADRGAQ
jgi:hypothetical protein